MYVMHSICKTSENTGTAMHSELFDKSIHKQLIIHTFHPGPLLLTWFNFNPSMDK